MQCNERTITETKIASVALCTVDSHGKNSDKIKVFRDARTS